MQLDRKKKILIIGGVVAGVLALFALLIALGGQTARVTAEIVVVPTDSNLSIDGEPATPGEVTLDEGNHTLKATREFFADATKEINTGTLNLDQPIYLVLEPNTPEGEQYLLDNQEQQMLRERAFGQEFSNTQESLLDQYPVISQLPYTTTDYKINYEVTENNDARFIVTLYPVATQPGTDLYRQQLRGFKADALQYLSDQGLNVDEANITFSPDPDD